VELALASYNRRRIGTAAIAYLAASSSRQSLAAVVPAPLTIGTADIRSESPADMMSECLADLLRNTHISASGRNTTWRTAVEQDYVLAAPARGTSQISNPLI
jgi:hypothetical protein